MAGWHEKSSAANLGDSIEFAIEARQLSDAFILRFGHRSSFEAGQSVGLSDHLIVQLAELENHAESPDIANEWAPVE